MASRTTVSEHPATIVGKAPAVKDAGTAIVGQSKQAKGYVLYADASHTDYPMYANNQVFPSTEFQTFLQQIWKNSGSGSNASPAIYAQPLAVQKNDWFGVNCENENRTVTVVWCYLNPVSAWQDQFQSNSCVAAVIATRGIADELSQLQHHSHQPECDQCEPAGGAHRVVRGVR